MNVFRSKFLVPARLEFILPGDRGVRSYPLETCYSYRELLQMYTGIKPMPFLVFNRLWKKNIKILKSLAESVLSAMVEIIPRIFTNCYAQID